MGAFASELELAAATLELNSPLDTALDLVGPLIGEGLDGVGVAESRAGLQGVLLVEADIGVVAESDRDTALSVRGSRLCGAVFG